MSSNDYLRQTLAHYREQRQRVLEQQLRPLDLMIRRIEADLGEVPEEPSLIELPSLSVPTITTEPNGDRKPTGNGKRPEIRADEFFTMTQGEAARTYLNKVGQAVALEELVEVLNKGGCPVGGADPHRTLYIALIRNTKDFCKIPNGYIGLRSMYSGLKAGAVQKATPSKKKAKGKKGKAGAKARAKAAKAAKSAKAKSAAKTTSVKPPSKSPSVKTEPAPQPTAEPQAARPPGQLKAAIREVLADGGLLSGDVIVKRVQEKLGPSVQRFTVYGILRNKKEFENVGDEYRLVQ